MPACPACGADYPDGKRFCRACGSPVPQASQPAAPTTPAPATTIECPTCGKPSASTTRFCRNCGSAIKPVIAPAEAAAAGARSPANQSVELPVADARHTFDGIPEAVPVSEPAKTPDPEPVYAQESVRAESERAGAARMPVQSPDVTSEVSTRRTWIGGGAALVVLVVLVAGWYFVKSRVPAVAGPDEGLLRSRLTAQLPPYVKLDSLQIQSSENIGDRVQPVFKTQFRGTVVLTADTFVQSSVEDGAVIVSPRVKRGETRQVDGVVLSRLSGGTPTTEFSLNDRQISELGQPQESFTGGRVLVQGSAEETVFRDQQRQRRDEEQRSAQARSDPEVAEQTQAVPPPATPPPSFDNARPEAERQKAEADAQAARRRFEAAREAELARADAQAARRRSEAAREAELARAAATAALEDQQRREAAERARSEALAAEERRQAEAAKRSAGIPAGTEMNVRLTTTLNSGKASAEDRFEATTTEDLTLNGRTVVPAGSSVRGVVASVQPATRTNRTARMTLSFDLLTIDAQAYPIRGHMTQAIAGPGIKGDARKIGAGAGVGAIIGGILGGGKGALAGILIGSGGTIAATEGKQVELPQGSVVRMRIDSPVQIR
jgi:double zinc ribbon protein